MAAPASVTSGWRAGGVATFCVSAFLLLSMGGAIVAAPVTVPLMFLIARTRPTRAFRTTAAALTGATVAEVVWVLTYVTTDESKPWIWLLPLVAAVAAVTALLQSSRPKSSAVP